MSQIDIPLVYLLESVLLLLLFSHVVSLLVGPVLQEKHLSLNLHMLLLSHLGLILGGVQHGITVSTGPHG